jgi:hypothetical protein
VYGFTVVPWVTNGKLFGYRLRTPPHGGLV